tara:strand:- start:43 stop:174 length:132 start_codon:yes stop_codon:yes gene_type:complete
MRNKKIAYFDNNTQKIQVRELSRLESLRRYFDKAFKKDASPPN